MPTFSDQLVGGEGFDRVLYLGGDVDRRGFEVPDYVSMRYNTLLHRYEFTNLVWDIGAQEYRTTTTDSGRTLFQQEYAFFQTRGIEDTQINTRGGDDVVRLDGEYRLRELTGSGTEQDPFVIGDVFGEEWGIDRGDLEQGAVDSIQIDVGAGDDQVFGTPYRDIIRGGDGDDLIVAGIGNDAVSGGDASDTIYGNSIDASSITENYFPPKPEFFEFFDFPPELHTLELAAPVSFTQTASVRRGLDLNAGVPIGAVAHYTFEDGTGNDAAGNGHDAALPNDGAIVNDEDRQSAVVELVRAGEWFDMPGNPFNVDAQLTTASPSGTYGFRFKLLEEGNAFIGSVAGLYDQLTFFAGTEEVGGGLRLHVGTGATQQSITSRDPLIVDRWYQGVVVWNTEGAIATVELLLDGESVGQVTRAASTSPALQAYFGGGQEMRIDETIVYNRALTAKELRQLTNRDSDIPIGFVDEVAFGLEGSANQRIGSLESYGDINADGFEDFLARGATKSYVLLGPVELTDLEDIETYAEVIIDHATLGRPAEGVGDINADGIQDFAFLTSDEDQLIARVVYGDQSIQSGYWDGTYWAQQDPEDTRRIELSHVYLGSKNRMETIELKLVDFLQERSESADLLIHSTTVATGSEGTSSQDPTSNYQNLDGSYLSGVFFSGLRIESSGFDQAENTVVALDIYDRSGELNYNSTGSTDVEILRGLTSSDSVHIAVNGSTVTRYDALSPVTVTGDPAKLIPDFTSFLDLSLGTIDVVEFSTVSMRVEPNASTTDEYMDLVDEVNANIANHEVFTTSGGEQRPSLANRLKAIPTENEAFKFEAVERYGVRVRAEERSSRLLGLENLAFPGPQSIVITRPLGGLQSLGSNGVTVDFSLASCPGTIDDCTQELFPFGTTSFSVEVLVDGDLSQLRTRIDDAINDSNVVVQLLNNRIVISDNRANRSMVVGQFDGIVDDPLLGGSQISSAPPVELEGTETSAFFASVIDPAENDESLAFYIDAPIANNLTPSLENLYQLGDVNKDGLNDLATVTAGTLEVFYGSNAGPTFETASFSVSGFDSIVNAFAADFEADGKPDLIVQHQPAGSEIQLAIFSDVVEQLDGGTTLTVAQAVKSLESATFESGFATVAHALDINRDGAEDLVIGAPMTDTLVNDQLTPNGGAVYIAYGAAPQRTVESPEDYDVLENFSVSGSGSFVADLGTGREIVFDDGGSPYSVAAGETSWYRFSLLGDGQVGDAIRFEGDVRANLVDSDGRVLAEDQRVFDLRTLEAGTYYLHIPAAAGFWNFVDNATLQSWTVLSGTANFASSQVGVGLKAGSSTGGFAHDAAHDNFLVASPSFRFDPLVDAEAPVLEVTFGGGNVTGSSGSNAVPSTSLYPNPAAIAGYNGGQSNQDGHKAIAFFNVSSGQYDGFVWDDTGNNGLATFTYTATELQARGVQTASGLYQLHFFDTDSGGWGWQQLNVASVAATREYSIHFDAPVRGQQQIVETDSNPDRDLLRGGDGNDEIVGNDRLDRIFGGSGVDTFTAEAFEVRDLDLADNQAFTPVPVSEQVQGNAIRVLDPLVIDANTEAPFHVASLQAAIARQLGDGVSVVDGVPSVNRSVTASELGSLTELVVGDGELFFGNPFHTQYNDPSQFVDISSTGNALGLSDDGRATITTTVGNSIFPAGQVTVGNNGVITSGIENVPTGGSLPVASFEHALAVFWDDIDSDSGDVYWEERSVNGIRTLIVQWHDRPRFQNIGRSTFQLQLFESGPLAARYVYPDVDFGDARYDFGDSATVGYQSNSRTAQTFFEDRPNLANGDVIDVYDNDLSLLREMVHLESLDLSGNPIVTDDLVHLEKLTRLRSLDLSDTHVDPTDPRTLAFIDQLPMLEELYLPTGQLSDSDVVATQGETVSLQTQTALDFDGSTNVLITSGSLDELPVGDQPYTLAAWIRPDSMGGRGIIGWGNYGSTRQVNAFRLTSNGLVNYWWSDDYSVNTGSLVGEWHHVAVTYNGAQRQIYLDGQPVGAPNTPGGDNNVPDTANFTIGQTAISISALNEHFDGKIRDVGVWNRALTADEIAFGTDATFEAIDSGRVAFWPLNEGTGLTVSAVDSAVPAVTVANAGFEDSITLGGINNFYSDIPSWNDPVGGSAGVSRPDLPWDDVVGGAQEGSRFAFIQAEGSFFQEINGLTVGESYTVEYLENERGAAAAAIGRSRVWIDGQVIVATHDVVHDASTWQTVTSTPFVATSTSMTLRFEHPGGGTADNTVFYDRVRVTPVPRVSTSLTLSGSASWTTGSPQPVDTTTVGRTEVEIDGITTPFVVLNTVPVLTTPSIPVIEEGQTLSIAAPANAIYPLELDGESFGNISLTDGGGTAGLGLRASVIDPLGRETSLVHRSAQFDNTSLKVPRESLDGATDLTVAFWLKSAPTATGEYVLNADSDANDFGIFFNEDFVRVFTDSVVYSWNTDVMSDGAFHHFAVVRSAQANQLSLYIDGEMHPNVQDAL
ncbi:MAG: LamG-like jellyroll fold domain-containing protein, partial [Planctomycetota bacterium]